MKNLEEHLNNFILKEGIGTYLKSKNEPDKTELIFNQIEMEKLAAIGILAYGVDGGLIINNARNFKGIFLIKPIGNNKYKFCGQVTPGFYISSYKSHPLYKKEFSEFENDLDNLLVNNSNFRIPDNCKKINTGNKEISFILLSEYVQFIFTKTTVLSHLEKISMLDNECQHIW